VHRLVQRLTYNLFTHFFVFPADDTGGVEAAIRKGSFESKTAKGDIGPSLTDRLGTRQPSFASFDRHIFEQKGVVISCVDGESSVKTLDR
jgi:hypothetical protein